MLRNRDGMRRLWGRVDFVGFNYSLQRQRVKVKLVSSSWHAYVTSKPMVRYVI